MQHRLVLRRQSSRAGKVRNYIKKHILKAHSWLAAGLLLTAASAFAAGGWGVIARIVDDKGNPVMGVGYQTEKPEDFR